MVCSHSHTVAQPVTRDLPAAVVPQDFLGCHVSQTSPPSTAVRDFVWQIVAYYEAAHLRTTGRCERDLPRAPRVCRTGTDHITTSIGSVHPPDELSLEPKFTAHQSVHRDARRLPSNAIGTSSTARQTASRRQRCTRGTSEISHAFRPWLRSRTPQHSYWQCMQLQLHRHRSLSRACHRTAAASRAHRPRRSPPPASRMQTSARATRPRAPHRLHTNASARTGTPADSAPPADSRTCLRRRPTCSQSACPRASALDPTTA